MHQGHRSGEPGWAHRHGLHKVVANAREQAIWTLFPAPERMVVCDGLSCPLLPPGLVTHMPFLHKLSPFAKALLGLCFQKETEAEGKWWSSLQSVLSCHFLHSNAWSSVDLQCASECIWRGGSVHVMHPWVGHRSPASSSVSGEWQQPHHR